MRKVLLISIMFFVSSATFAQKNSCQCDVAFEDLIEKVEENYIVLAQMKIDKTTADYKNRILNYRKKVLDIAPENCTKFLKEFLSYFKDGHLSVFERPEFTKEKLELNKKKIKREKVSITSILRVVEYQKDIVEKTHLDGIIGKWTSGESEIAIIKDEGFYRAYILSSKNKDLEPGELKAEIKGTEKGFESTYIHDNYSKSYKGGGLYKERTLLRFSGGPIWAKIEPVDMREIEMINKENLKLPVIKKLDEKTTLFTIPSFSADYQKFIKIVFDNEKLLSNTTNLIFDIRGNTGGNAIYMSFIELYADRSGRGKTGKVLASKATQKYFERYVKNSPKIYAPVVERIKKSIGEIVDGPTYPYREYKQSKKYKVRNVAILTDNGCMSAAESFIIHSKRYSSKVKTFGSSTKGVIDYTSVNSLKLKGSGTQNIYFGYPTGTLTEEVFPKNGGFNKTGIIPDVPIKKRIKDKIKFIMKYYKNK